MITHFLRLFLAHQVKPFQFQKAIGELPNFDLPQMGLYVHIPFCKVLCPFCPYYKIKYSNEYHTKYLKALLAEIKLIGQKTSETEKRKVSSLYFGGGSPATMLNDLHTIKNALNEFYTIEGSSGIELHPQDIHNDTPTKLKDAGFDMVSVGIQSFSEKLLNNIGREKLDFDAVFKLLRKGIFNVIDVDLIFGIPEQKESDLKADFLHAVNLGATQISTYPFIDFSYAHNKKKPQSHSNKKKLLNVLLQTAEEAGFERTSVWTFAQKNTKRYSSVTRDCFLGFGPGAASLGSDVFKVNIFSVDAYIETLSKSTIPTSLKMQFSTRARKAYWLFWNCYNNFLSKAKYKNLFSADLEKDFSLWLKLGEITGLLSKTENGWQLTNKGSYYFNCVEQKYTNQYIDKTWRLAMENPLTEKINLY